MGEHSTGVLKIPRLHSRSVRSDFQKRPSSAAANLIPPPDYHIYFLSEKDVL
jgi:hypothetical protein